MDWRYSLTPFVENNGVSRILQGPDMVLFSHQINVACFKVAAGSNYR